MFDLQVPVMNAIHAHPDQRLSPEARAAPAIAAWWLFEHLQADGGALKQMTPEPVRRQDLKPGPPNTTTASAANTEEHNMAPKDRAWMEGERQVIRERANKGAELGLDGMDYEVKLGMEARGVAWTREN